MPKRRAIGRGLSAAAEALSPALSSWVTGLRQKQQNEAILGRQTDIDLLNRKQTLQDKVAKGEISPDQASSIWKSQTGTAEDFSTFGPSLDNRVGKISADIAGAKDLSSLPTEQRVRRRMSELNVPEVSPVMADNPSSVGGDFPLVADTKPSDQATSLMTELAASKANLTAQAPRTSVEDFDPTTLAPRRRMLRTDEMGSLGDMQTAPTPAQKSQMTADELLADALNQIPEMKGRQAGDESISKIKTSGGAEATQAGRVAGAQAGADLGVKSSPAGLAFLQTQADIANSAKQPTIPETQAYDFAGRVATAHERMMQLEPAIMKRGAVTNWAAFVNPDILKDPTTRAYVTAMRELINANLRRESGAAISKDEYVQAQKLYGYNEGDDASSMKYKQGARRRTIQGMAGSAGPKLGQLFATIDELKVIAAQRGQPLEAVLSEARSKGLRVIY